MKLGAKLLVRIATQFCLRLTHIKRVSFYDKTNKEKPNKRKYQKSGDVGGRKRAKKFNTASSSLASSVTDHPTAATSLKLSYGGDNGNSSPKEQQQQQHQTWQ